MRISVARTLVDACAVDYGIGEMSEDIPSWRQTVDTYQTPAGQRKYVHMYFAKSVACWRDLRRRLLAPNDGTVISIGAGPCLCLVGWFWDTAPGDGQIITAVDVLDWQHVRGLSSHSAMIASVLGDPNALSFLSGRYFPNGPQPPQTNCVAALTPLKPSEIEEGSTVLVPFVLNHVVGQHNPVCNHEAVYTWLESVRLRAKRVLIIDMQADDTTQPFWAGIQAGLNAHNHPTCLEAKHISEFSGAYSPTAGDRWPSRRTSYHMRRYTAVTGDGTGWKFVEE